MQQTSNTKVSIGEAGNDDAYNTISTHNPGKLIRVSLRDAQPAGGGGASGGDLGRSRERGEAFRESRSRDGPARVGGKKLKTKKLETTTDIRKQHNTDWISH